MVTKIISALQGEFHRLSVELPQRLHGKIIHRVSHAEYLMTLLLKYSRNDEEDTTAMLSSMVPPSLTCVKFSKNGEEDTTAMLSPVL